MAIVNWFERCIYQTPAWRMVAAVLLIMLVKTGIWVAPHIAALSEMAQNPFINPFEDSNAQYNFTTWLGSYWAYIVHARTPLPYFLVHLGYTLAFTAVFITALFTRLPNEQARTALIIFAAIPASASPYFWVHGDGLTLGLMTLALAVPKRSYIVWPASILLGLQHFEQGSLGAFAVLFALTLGKFFKDENEYTIKFAATMLAGVLAGKLIQIGIFSYYEISLEYGRGYWLMSHLDALLWGTFMHPNAVLFSVLGVGWLAMIRYLDRGWKAVPFVLTFAGLLPLLAVSGDQTRVFAGLTFPLLCVYLLFNKSFLSMLSQREVAVGFLVWLLVPWFWTWGGVPRGSAFPFDVVYLLHHFFGWFEVPADPGPWPF